MLTTVLLCKTVNNVVDLLNNECYFVVKSQFVTKYFGNFSV